MQAQDISPVLVKTWFTNLQGESQEARARAKEMLLETFGSEENIMSYFLEQGWVNKDRK